MDAALSALLEWLQHWPPEAVWILLVLVCFSSVVILHRLFGQLGLSAYVVLAIIGANIQVLKAVQFRVFDEPVALGTVLFSSSYLATDILAELYGVQAARRTVFLGFATFFLFVVFMLVTIAFSPLTPEQAGTDMAWALPFHDHVAALFTPTPSLFVAGMIAYLSSQVLDIWIFDRLRRAADGKKLWLRNNVSTAISALVDNLIFSVLAWIVLKAEPLQWATVLTTYVFGTYVLRLVVALIDTPFAYAARAWRPRS